MHTFADSTVFLQKRYTVDFLTKKTKANHGEIPQYYVENDHEAIISPQVFDLAQEEIKRRAVEEYLAQQKKKEEENAQPEKNDK